MFDSSKKFIKAAKDGDMATVMNYLRKYYYSGKVDLNEADEQGITALSHAARAGHAEILGKMIAFGLDREKADNEGNTPLLAAQVEKKNNSIDTLLSYGVNVNAHTNAYIYPLHFAAHEGDVDRVRQFLDKGAAVDVVITNNGYTPLHWAVSRGHANVAEALVQAGARLDMPDKKGRTPMDIARQVGAHMVKILETPPKPVPVPAPEAAEEKQTAAVAPVPAAVTYEGSDKWVRTGENHVTHIGEYPAVNRKLTEIFNFETRERLVVNENLKTGAETVSPVESFDTVAESALRKALFEFQRLGGKAEEDSVLGNRSLPKRSLRP